MTAPQSQSENACVRREIHHNRPGSLRVRLSWQKRANALRNHHANHHHYSLLGRMSARALSLSSCRLFRGCTCTSTLGWLSGSSSCTHWRPALEFSILKEGADSLARISLIPLRAISASASKVGQVNGKHSPEEI